MKIIHTADIHLNSKMESSLNSEQAKMRKVELLRTFSRMIDFANDNDVQTIIIAGDLFDTESINKSTKDYVLSLISNNPHITFLYLCGNHEKTAFVDSIDSMPSNLLTFGNDWTYHNLENNVVVAGINITKENSKSLYSSLKLSKTNTNIVVMHGQVSKYFSKDTYEIVNITELKNKNIDYLALGHIHSYSIDVLDDHANYCYPGCLEGRGFDECGDHGFVLLDVNQKSVQSTFIPFAKRKIYEINVDVSGAKNTIEIDSLIQSAIANISKDSLIKINLIGKVKEDFNIDFSILSSALNEIYYFVKIVNKTTLSINISDYQNDVSIKGEFVRKVLSSNLSDIEKEQVILYGLRALNGESDL